MNLCLCDFTYACEVILGKILNELLVYHFGMPRSWEVQKCENQHQGVPSAKVATKNRHQKPPKPPVGGISPSPLDETCWASNFVWKIGIIHLIRTTQSKVRGFQKLQKSSKMTDFQSVVLWTAWSELSLWYQFSTQNLMPSKFHLIGLAKFRQVAILAVFCGYFLWLLPRGWVNNVATYAILFLHGYVTFCRIL